MALKLMYITNRPEVARIAAAAGVDRIFVDMEFIGKSVRQGGMDTVQNHHTIEDIRTIREAAQFRNEPMTAPKSDANTTQKTSNGLYS